MSELPLQHYPLLTKFTNVTSVKIGPYGSDAKLEALSRLPLLRLKHVVLMDSADVTDAGILAIVRLPGITSLDLRQTSVTDAGLRAA